MDDAQSDIRMFLSRILRGERDTTLRSFARAVQTNNQPVLVSFMPEFDNPDRVAVRLVGRGGNLPVGWCAVFRIVQQKFIRVVVILCRVNGFA